jgi:chromosome segregation ATPase
LKCPFMNTSLSWYIKIGMVIILLVWAATERNAAALQSAQGQWFDSSARLAGISAELASSKALSSDLGSQVETSKQALEGMSAELASYKAESLDLGSQVAAAKQALKGVSAELASLKAEFLDQGSQVEAALVEVQCTKDAMAKVEQQAGAQLLVRGGGRVNTHFI